MEQSHTLVIGSDLTRVESAFIYGHLTTMVSDDIKYWHHNTFIYLLFCLYGYVYRHTHDQIVNKKFFSLELFFSSLIRLIKYTHTLFLTRKRTTFSFFHFLIFCLASFLHSFLDTSVCFHLSLNNFSPFYPHILISL